jgi:hypothetical protein
MTKNINIVYELNTPIGYLGMGYDIKSIPFIFEYINKLSTSNYNTIRYSSSGNYRKLIDGFDLAHNLNLSNGGLKKQITISQKLYSDLTRDNLTNDINIFNIATLADETMLDYIKHVNLESLFLPATLNFIKNNHTVKIVFSDNREGAYIYDDAFFNKFYDFIKKLKLHHTQLCFLTNTANVFDQYSKFLNRNNLNSFMISAYVPFLITPEAGGHLIETEAQNYKTSYNDYIYTLPKIKEIDKRRSHYYLCLNRNSERLHRAQLILQLIKNGIFEKGKISLFKSSGLDKFAEGNPDYKNLIVDRYPFILDEENPKTVAMMNGYLTKKDMWLNTYFSVVNETSILPNTVFITEKTIRPMLYYHPFIIWGNPKTLEYLKKLGFETFPELFNEDYDQIIDHEQRLSCIMDNINNLCNKDLTEVHKIYQEIKPKLIHNYNLLKRFYTDGMLLSIISDSLDNKQ